MDDDLISMLGEYFEGRNRATVPSDFIRMVSNKAAREVAAETEQTRLNTRMFCIDKAITLVTLFEGDTTFLDVFILAKQIERYLIFGEFMDPVAVRRQAMGNTTETMGE